MKFMAKFMLILGLFAVILAGCGTSQNDSGNGSDPGQNEEETASDGQDGQEQTEEQDPAEEGTVDEGQSVIRILEQNMTYTVEGEAKEETAFLKHSDNQNYSMYVLPAYELTAEEPNKDVLYLSENDQVFMRIELLPNDADWNMVEENTKAQLGAVSENVQTADAPSDDFYKDANVMKAEGNGEKVSAYLVKNEDLSLKLTLFNKEEADHEEAFLQMAKTIMKEEPQK
ncbi:MULTISPECIES: hypothetical protein [Cytobacillus]|uniref:Lipoprotein n=3 Tax=Bacillaceae TaxID=186817 RepID=A0ABX3CJZ8_9BACI|nr:hypothetical protein [Cytobacillus oceanisediminis]MCS0823100.1 hypothetical protein [Cytobacillus firmus]MCM3400553.1 hypothetical protein [Cytobacillus oceanisediminis]MDK7664821.1 hypothetical protein [Cytobacillus oceanisediminis]OHX38788.1 hypothetical protein BBV17_04585 [Cytobacillus oceanisediminis]QOK27714.1 hypothetical protein IIE26_03335 [Cytobacillus oceanisediminis]